MTDEAKKAAITWTSDSECSTRHFSPECDGLTNEELKDLLLESELSRPDNGKWGVDWDPVDLRGSGSRYGDCDFCRTHHGDEHIHQHRAYGGWCGCSECQEREAIHGDLLDEINAGLRHAFGDEPEVESVRQAIDTVREAIWGRS